MFLIALNGLSVLNLNVICPGMKTPPTPAPLRQPGEGSIIPDLCPSLWLLCGFRYPAPPIHEMGMSNRRTLRGQLRLRPMGFFSNLSFISFGVCISHLACRVTFVVFILFILGFQHCSVESCFQCDNTNLHGAVPQIGPTFNPRRFWHSTSQICFVRSTTLVPLIPSLAVKAS